MRGLTQERSGDTLRSLSNMYIATLHTDLLLKVSNQITLYSTQYSTTLSLCHATQNPLVSHILIALPWTRLPGKGRNKMVSTRSTATPMDNPGAHRSLGGTGTSGTEEILGSIGGEPTQDTNPENEGATSSRTESLEDPIGVEANTTLPTAESLRTMSQDELDEIERQLQARADRAAQERRILTLSHRTRADERAVQLGECAPEETSLPRGTKRPRTDTVIMKDPPKFKVDTRFSARSVSEYNAFIRRAEIHFRNYEPWYDDARKINETLSMLDDKRLQQWGVHEKAGGGPENFTWRQFKSFLLALVQDPKVMRRQVSYKYHNAKQLPSQSVREFSVYLEECEEMLDQQYTDPQRISLLEAKVLKVIQDEIPKYSERPNTYEAFISHLQTIEDNIPERVAARKSGDKDKSNASVGRTKTGSKATDTDNTAKEKRESKKPATKENITCFYCDKKGHIERECRKKAQDEKAKTEPITDSKK